MAANSGSFHESEAQLTPHTRDMHRAIVSLMEELEAIDWYQQRADVTLDGELRQVLLHNKAEEQEHAAMVLEWIRRRDPGFDGHLRHYLFTEGSIAAQEEALNAKQNARGGRPGAAPTVSVGSLKGGH